VKSSGPRPRREHSRGLGCCIGRLLRSSSQHLQTNRDSFRAHHPASARYSRCHGRKNVAPRAGSRTSEPADALPLLPPPGARVHDYHARPARGAPEGMRPRNPRGRCPHAPRKRLHAPELARGKRKKPATARPGKPKTSILLYLSAARRTQDMWTLKPEPRPRGVRGESSRSSHKRDRRADLRTPAANVGSGCTTRQIVRSVNHRPVPQLPASYTLRTTDAEQHPRDTDPPSMGSVLRVPARRARRPAGLTSTCRAGSVGSSVPDWPVRGDARSQVRPAHLECEPSRTKARTRQGKPSVVRGAPVSAQHRFGTTYG